MKIIKYFLSNFQQKNNNYIVKYTITLKYYGL